MTPKLIPFGPSCIRAIHRDDTNEQFGFIHIVPQALDAFRETGLLPLYRFNKPSGELKRKDPLVRVFVEYPRHSSLLILRCLSQQIEIEIDKEREEVREGERKREIVRSL